MTESLFLQVDPNTRITYDNLQWIIQTRKQEGSRWKSKSFVASNLKTLRRVLDEMGVQPTPEAAKVLDDDLAFRTWLERKPMVERTVTD